MKRNESGQILCHSKDCGNLASHFIVWTEPIFCCEPCATGWINVGNAMGFPTPGQTVRPMTEDELKAKVNE